MTHTGLNKLKQIFLRENTLKITQHGYGHVLISIYDPVDQQSYYTVTKLENIAKMFFHLDKLQMEKNQTQENHRKTYDFDKKKWVLKQSEKKPKSEKPASLIFLTGKE